PLRSSTPHFSTRPWPSPRRWPSPSSGWSSFSKSSSSAGRRTRHPASDREERMSPAERPASVREPSREVPVVADTDVLVVGGGPAGVAAAVEASRQGARAILAERYPYLGGMASGGMVLVIDDMMDGPRQTVLGIAQEYVERLERIGAAVYPPVEDRYRVDRQLWNRWARWGCYDIYHRGRLKPITYSVAFDPDGWKAVYNDLVAEAGVTLRLHSWFSEPLLEGDTLVGGVFETPEGRQAIRAR